MSSKNFTASVHYDRRLYKYDIAGSIAHTHMLARQAIISEKETELIVKALLSIESEIELGTFVWQDTLEDLHMNIEFRLHEKIGSIAGKLHTARSRNDQIALDERLYVKQVVVETVNRLSTLQKTILDKAETYQGIILPGYTHLQRAQPILLAHHFLAYFEMFDRDVHRYQECFRRTDVLPLGSAALAGTPHPVDREFLAQELGFSRVSANSMDAVSDRDFVLDYLFATATCMMHLSRFGEELVLWSSQEFDFIRIDDHFVSGSSIMPQKRNPDVAELVRGKTGRIYGHLFALLTVLKGLPLAYNRDLQEDKESLFGAVDTILPALEVFANMISTLKPNPDRMRQASLESPILATDLADYLVKKDVPFRQAHGIVAQVVQHAADNGKLLSQLKTEELQQYSPLFKNDVQSITLESSVAARDVLGGTAPERVREAIRIARQRLEDLHES